MSFTLEQDSQKSGGAMPPKSEKWRGHWPPAPPPPVLPPMDLNDMLAQQQLSAMTVAAAESL